MYYLVGCPKYYHWGSTSIIPKFQGNLPTGKKVAEVWYGTHPAGKTYVFSLENTSPQSLAINSNQTSIPQRKLFHKTTLKHTLEECLDNVAAKDYYSKVLTKPNSKATYHLPYLLKILAVNNPLSLQVHPKQLDTQNNSTSPNNVEEPTLLDQNIGEKKELIYAIDTFETLVGFCNLKEAQVRLTGLDNPIIDSIKLDLTHKPLNRICEGILCHPKEYQSSQIIDLKKICLNRLASNRSPCPKIDAAISKILDLYPKDTSFPILWLMNYLELSPGQAIFIPPKTVHMHQKGFGLELMNNSDNVVRAAFTPKPVDRMRFLQIGDFTATAPSVLDPISENGIKTYSADELALKTISLSLDGKPQELQLNLPRPSIMLVLTGEANLTLIKYENSISVNTSQTAYITQADCLFIPPGKVKIQGAGTFAYGYTI